MSKLLIAALISLVSTSAFATATCDKRDLERALQLKADSLVRVNNGLMPPIELSKVELNLIEAQHCSTTNPDDSAYCIRTLAAQIRVLENAEAKIRAGMTNIDEVIEAQRSIRETKKNCGIIEPK